MFVSVRDLYNFYIESVYHQGLLSREYNSCLGCRIKLSSVVKYFQSKVDFHKKRFNLVLYFEIFIQLYKIKKFSISKLHPNNDCIVKCKKSDTFV